MKPANASFFHDAAEIVSPAGTTARRVFHCCECKTVTRLSDLNGEMQCAKCGEPEEDPEDVIDTSDGEMVREHGFY